MSLQSCSDKINESKIKINESKIWRKGIKHTELERRVENIKVYLQRPIENANSYYRDMKVILLHGKFVA